MPEFINFAIGSWGSTFGRQIFSFLSTGTLIHLHLSWAAFGGKFFALRPPESKWNTTPTIPSGHGENMHKMWDAVLPRMMALSHAMGTTVCNVWPFLTRPDPLASCQNYTATELLESNVEPLLTNIAPLLPSQLLEIGVLVEKFCTQEILGLLLALNNNVK